MGINHGQFTTITMRGGCARITYDGRIHSYTGERAAGILTFDTDDYAIRCANCGVTPGSVIPITDIGYWYRDRERGGQYAPAMNALPRQFRDDMPPGTLCPATPEEMLAFVGRELTRIASDHKASASVRALIPAINRTLAAAQSLALAS